MKTEKEADNLDGLYIPKHIAIIMDGNGRWATQKGLPRSAGHRAGVEALREIIQWSSEVGIKYLTLYAFSTENWKRPREEVNFLMALLQEYIEKEIEELHRKQVKISFIGRIEDIPSNSQKSISFALQKTKGNQGLNVIFALNYGGRAEIVDAVKKVAEEYHMGKVALHRIDETYFSEKLYTAGTPDPELLIRTSGELRISNFLLWQLAYTELWITKVLWPDFTKKHLLQAIEDFNERHRRFGGI
jgi:undecaprenyl diphosphate synthase